jgi:hypothetical protein
LLSEIEYATARTMAIVTGQAPERVARHLPVNLQSKCGMPIAPGLPVTEDRFAIDGIQSATFLTQEQKRDILHDNAARFLRLTELPR